MQCRPVWEDRWSKCSPLVWEGLLQTLGGGWFRNGWRSFVRGVFIVGVSVVIVG